MISSTATTVRISPLPMRIVAAWNAVATRWNPVAVIAVACLVLAGPLIVFRGYNSHEGLAVTVARTMLETGNWLAPHMYNVRYIESPELQARIIAAVSAPFGGVTQISARLSSFLFLAGGCFLIYGLLRKVAASIPAALFGVALFLACPLVMRLYVSLTPDMPLAVLLFAAFVLWWNGHSQGSVTFGRWLAIGVVLALAAMVKGPEPVGYFGLGIGVFVLVKRVWREIPGLILAGVICIIPVALWAASIFTPGDQVDWAAFMRLSHPHATFYGPLPGLVHAVAEMLPAMLAAAAFLVSRGFRDKKFEPPDLVAALSSYAFVAAIFVLFWPAGSTPRYFLPMVLPLCVFGGLGYDQLNARRPQIVAPLLALTAALLTYAVAYAAASPFFPQQFRQSQVEGARVSALVQAAPGPVYWFGDVALNLLPYLPGPIANAAPDELAVIPGPAWIIMTDADAETLLARRPEKLHVVMPLGELGQWRLLRLDP
jgi:4-amino-4-deoxy-L-arabinose transferase-like glycosyltransferase